MTSPSSMAADRSPAIIAPSTVHPNGTNVDKEPSSTPQIAPLSNGTSQNADAQTLSQPPATSIEERKQQAKAIVAASALATEPVHSATVSPERTTSPHTLENHTNGNMPSRKRSRSGTRLVQPPRAVETLPQRTKESRDSVQHERDVNRDLIGTAAIVAARISGRGLLQSKVDENLFYRSDKFQAWRAGNTSAVFGPGYAGYGNGHTDIQGHGTKVVYPMHRKRPGGRKSKELHISRKDRATQADQLDELVPIRLDIEWDKIRLRDTFTWNIHDRLITPELFAEQLVEDFKLPLDQCGHLVRLVAESIQEQIQDFHPHIHLTEEALDPHLPYFAYKNDEMRIIVKLNITIGQHTIMDQFEWEINNPMNSPEEFAKQMTQDLSLSGEFTTAIAHSIREQSQLFTRSLYVTGHPFDGRPIEDPELQASFLPSPLPSPFRPYQAAKDFTPYLFEMNEGDLEKTELSLSREERRQKRSTNRRGGPILPDLKDRRRTIRTMIVSSVLPGAVESMEDSRIFKRSGASKGRRGLGHRDGGDDSDDSESEDSSPDSPAIPTHLLAGTARTRGMRGAASAAQAAMRANLGRSATPESVNLHHHETRTSGRRVVGREFRDESSPEPPASLIVKLRIPRQRFQQFLRDLRAKSKENKDVKEEPARPVSRSSANTTPAAPAPGSMGPPSTTPRPQSRSLPEKTEEQSSEPVNSMRHGSSSQLGRIDAVGPPSAEHPIPPPPAYLEHALATLRTKYPLDAFEGTMRYTAVSTETDDPISLRPDAPPPPNTKFCYYPRIKCKDCPGKLYTPGPLMGVDNFEVHLRNRHHRDRVAKRVGDAGSQRSPA